MLEPENIFLLKLGLRVHKAGYGRSVSTALFLCRSVHRKFLNVIVIPLYGSSGRPAKLHALSGQQYKAVVRFSLPGRQTNLRPGAVDVKNALRHAYKAFDLSLIHIYPLIGKAIALGEEHPGMAFHEASFNSELTKVENEYIERFGYGEATAEETASELLAELESICEPLRTA